MSDQNRILKNHSMMHAWLVTVSNKYTDSGRETRWFDYLQEQLKSIGAQFMFNGEHMIFETPQDLTRFLLQYSSVNLTGDTHENS